MPQCVQHNAVKEQIAQKYEHTTTTAVKTKASANQYEVQPSEVRANKYQQIKQMAMQWVMQRVRDKWKVKAKATITINNIENKRLQMDEAL